MRQIVQGALDLLVRVLQLRRIHQRSGPCEAPARTVGDGYYHLQIARQLDGRRRRWSGLLLGFQKQPRLFQNPRPDTFRRFAPGGIDLGGLPGGEPVCGKCHGQALAIVQAHARHRDQTLHRHLRGDLPRTYFLLDAAGKKFNQSQPPGNPTRAAIETPRQILNRVAEVLFQFGKQPSFLDRRLSFR